MKLNGYFLGIFIIITLMSCGLECADKKTGLQKSSANIEDSKENNVFRFPFITKTKHLLIDHERVLNIKNAWVENSWTYECINNRAILKKGKKLQFVIETEYHSPKSDSIHYFLWLENNKYGNGLGAEMKFDYNGEDTLKFVLRNENRKTLDTLKFWRNLNDK